MELIGNETDLAAFRSRQLTPFNILERVEESWISLIDLPVGVGKSHLVDDLIAAEVTRERFDLVIYMTNQNRTLDERRIVQLHPTLPSQDQAGVLRLTGRPRELCGSLDRAWSYLEKKGCSTLARQTQCTVCPHRSQCRWFSQLSSKSLEGKSVVLATQSSWILFHGLLDRLISQTGAHRALLLVDESKFIEESIHKRIKPEHCKQLRGAIQELPQSIPDDDRIVCDAYLALIRAAEEESHEWLAVTNPLPPIPLTVAAELQKKGLLRFRGGFRYCARQLQEFASAPTRFRCLYPTGELAYLRRPQLPADPHRVVILSADLTPDLIKRRLGVGTVRRTFPEVRFQHEGTRFFNLCWSGGAKSHVRRNGPAFLWCVLQLVEKNMAANQRTLLVASKSLVPFSIERLKEFARFMKLDVHFVRSEELDKRDIGNPRVVPIIHFGIVGENRFEGYESCFCLNTFNAPVAGVAEFTNDTQLSPDRIGVEIVTDHLGRRVRLTAPTSDSATTQRIAEEALMYIENRTVEQAVGRCRFVTKPRVVITQQRNPLPYDHEQKFTTLAALRLAFGLTTRREYAVALTHKRVQQAKQEGLSQRQTARETGFAKRTVERHWNA